MRDRKKPEILYYYELGKNGDKRVIGSLKRPLKGKGVERNRADYLKCRYYDECLDFAAQKNLKSFTCRACPQFEDNKYINRG